MPDYSASKKCSTGRRALPGGPYPGNNPRLIRAEFQTFMEQQGNACLICPAAPPDHVDRDLKTGKVRGVPCFSCHTALGQFRDRPALTRRAAANVEGNVWKPTLVAPGVCQLPS